MIRLSSPLDKKNPEQSISHHSGSTYMCNRNVFRGLVYSLMHMPSFYENIPITLLL